MSHTLSTWILGALALVLMAGVCEAQARPARSGLRPKPGKYVTLLPELANLPAPDWVKPGMRLSYYGASASVVNDRAPMVEDPNGPYVDPKTGKRYSRGEDHGVEYTGGSGECLCQFDIIAVEDGAVAVLMTPFQYQRSLGAIWPDEPSVTFEYVTGGNFEDVWIHPQGLLKLLEADLDDVLVLRGPWTQDGKTYDTVAIVSRQGYYDSKVFDLETGIALSSTGHSPGGIQNGPVPRQAPSTRTMARFLGARQLPAALVDGHPPRWTATTRGMRYEGEVVYSPPGSQLPLRLDVTANLAFGGGSDDWRAYSVTTITSGRSAAYPGAGRGLGAYWIDPGQLEALEGEGLLDEDPVTGMRVEVLGTTTTREGKKVIGILSRNRTVTYERVYDMETGTLLQLGCENSVECASAWLRLEETR